MVTLDALLKELQLKKSFVPDIVFVDILTYAQVSVIALAALIVTPWSRQLQKS